MSHLFKSRKERERDERRERRQAFRKAENAIEEVKDRIKDLEKEAQKYWTQARDALKAGQKAAAQRFLTSYRASQILQIKLEQKRWVFEQYLTKMKVADSDNAFAHALGAINKVIQIDPERVADVFDEASDILGEQVDADRFWNRLYEKEMEGASGALEDHIPSLEELSRQLESEAAAEIGGGAERTAGDLDTRMAENQERIRKLLDGK